MSKWKCAKCGNTDGVINGFCKVDGPIRTKPVDKEAEVEAGVEVAAQNKVDNTEADLEAEKRNQASIEAGAGTTIRPEDL